MTSARLPCVRETRSELPRLRGARLSRQAQVLRNRRLPTRAYANSVADRIATDFSISGEAVAGGEEDYNCFGPRRRVGSSFAWTTTRPRRLAENLPVDGARMWRRAGMSARRP
jgi:hypothetical protein